MSDFTKEFQGFIDDMLNDIIVGKSKMDFLNSKIIESFLFCPAVNSFLQSMTGNYLLCLWYRDVKTSKQIFQLIKD